MKRTWKPTLVTHKDGVTLIVGCPRKFIRPEDCHRASEGEPCLYFGKLCVKFKKIDMRDEYPHLEE
jgi:hypothetical protein